MGMTEKTYEGTICGDENVWNVLHSYGVTQLRIFIKTQILHIKQQILLYSIIPLNKFNYFSPTGKFWNKSP